MLLDNVKELYINNKAVSSLYYSGNQIWTANTEPLEGLAAYSWAQIAEISKAGNMDNYFTVGETKQLTLYDGTVATFCYVGQEADVNGTYGMVFMQIDNFNTSKWYTSTSSWRTYTGSTVGDACLSNIMNSDVVQNGCLRRVNKYYKSKSGSTSKSYSSFQVWIPSITEITGKSMSPNISNGVTYSYTTTDEFKQKWYSSIQTAGVGSSFWLRDNDSTGYAYKGDFYSNNSSLSKWTTELPYAMMFMI